ncbi:superoxide dismutase [Mn/Fe]-like [Protopterus annectens]|uniref:superoxide dismutase [Mn/Fe]-like n=1 Tax=Protopterus annectens TaxID=7888 RepID=UPI001CFB3A11|nr:superoxide dismutase [Mn/Fe]-like [Protopterus annectens]
MPHLIRIAIFCCFLFCFVLSSGGSPSLFAVLDSLNKYSESYVLPPLPFGFSDLEPYIDAQTVQVHYLGHHATYLTKLNQALASWRNYGLTQSIDETLQQSLFDILRHPEKIPEKYRTDIVNNGGGFINHVFYWMTMSKNIHMKDRLPSHRMQHLINEAFGNFMKFKEAFNAEASKLFGSGYVWLCRDASSSDKLHIVTTSNQDSPLLQGFQPLLVIDVWEHAYYLKHQNIRANYIRDWWMTVDWSAVDVLLNWWTTQSAHDEL